MLVMVVGVDADVVHHLSARHAGGQIDDEDVL